MTSGADPGGRRHLAFLTRFLMAVSLLAAGALVLGEDGGEDEAAAVAPVPSVTTPASSSPRAAPSTTRTSTTAPSPSTTTSSSTTSTVLPTTTITTTTTTRATPTEPLDAGQIRELVAPSVAFVTTLNGTGSGVLIGERLLVTNGHVVWPFEAVGVLFPDRPGRRPGRVLAVDPFADIALVEVGGRVPLPPPVLIASEEEVDSGDPLFVIGYPEPSSLGPEPTIVEATFREVRDWAFSGIRWVEAAGPAISGQSGGALVTETGALIGITTFGNLSDLYAAAIDDVEDLALRLETDPETRGIMVRPLPRSGGRRTLEVELGGPWDQALFLVWVSGGVETDVAADRPDVRFTALDFGGAVVEEGVGQIEIDWVSSIPGVVAVGADEAGPVGLESTLPMVPLDDPDDGRPIAAGELIVGMIDTPGDRDHYFLDVAAPADDIVVAVRARTRARITVYGPDASRPIVSRQDRTGFFFSDPTVSFDAAVAGRYVIAVEDVGAQFGPYELSVG
ncbi:MAG: serine protease [Acidimicrobiia bacterium]